MVALDFEYLARIYAAGLYENVCMGFVVAGIHLFMAMYGLAVFLETREHLKKGRLLYIAISFVLVALTAFKASVKASWAFKLLFEGTSPQDSVQLAKKYWLSWDRIATDVSLVILVFIGDALLVYRCWVISKWQNRQWLAILPALTCLGALALDIALIPLQSRKGADIPLGKHRAAKTILTVFTNVYVTSVIAFSLIRARRRFSEALSSSHLQLYTGRVAILIESALPLSLFGIFDAVIMFLPIQKTNIARAVHIQLVNIVPSLFYAFASLSPQMIIFNVTIGRSWASKFPNVDEQGRISSGIAFDNGPSGANSTFLESVVNRGLGKEPGRQDA